MKKVLIALTFLMAFAVPSLCTADGEIIVKTTQDLSVLGIPCTLEGGDASIEKRVYKCTVEGGGMQSILFMLKGVIKYVTYLVALCGVLALVYAGIRYSTSGFDEEGKTAAKDLIIQIIGGLTLLFMM